MPRPKIKKNPIQAERLNELLKKNGITAADLSKHSGVSQSQISDIKNGRANMSETAAFAFCEKVFKEVNPDWLLGKSNCYYLDSTKINAIFEEEGFRICTREKELLENLLSLSGYLITSDFQERHKDKTGTEWFAPSTYSIYYKGRKIKVISEEEADRIYKIARDVRLHATLSFSREFGVPFPENNIFERSNNDVEKSK